MQVANLWKDWAKANELWVVHNNTTAHNMAGHPQEQWQPPRHGFVKCNVDATFFDTIDKTG
jgi:hypothetical protein